MKLDLFIENQLIGIPFTKTKITYSKREMLKDFDPKVTLLIYDCSLEHYKHPRYHYNMCDVCNVFDEIDLSFVTFKGHTVYAFTFNTPYEKEVAINRYTGKTIKELTKEVLKDMSKPQRQ